VTFSLLRHKTPHTNSTSKAASVVQR